MPERDPLDRTVVSVVDDHLGEPWMWLLDGFIDAPNTVDVLGNTQCPRAIRSN